MLISILVLSVLILIIFIYTGIFTLLNSEAEYLAIGAVFMSLITLIVIALSIVQVAIGCGN